MMLLHSDRNRTASLDVFLRMFQVGPVQTNAEERCANKPFNNMVLVIYFWLKADFHQIGPLGRVGLVVDMSMCLSVCLSVCLSPSHVIFF